MAETPVGQAPATGGRVREHATDADRARAWRERRRRGESSGPGAGTSAEDAAPEPTLAVAGLASTVEQLRAVAREHHAAVAGQVDRLTRALDVLADPAAVDRALESARVEAERRVAEAHAELLAAQSAAAHARGQAEAARAEAVEAGAAADAAWRRVDELDAALADRDDRITALHEQVDRVQQRLVAHVAAAREEADEARREERSAHAAELQEARSQAARAAGERDRLAATVDRLEEELRHAREQLPAAVAAARTEAAEQAAARCAAQLEALRARTDGQIAGLTARLEAAGDLAASHRDEAARLARQLDQRIRDAAAPPLTRTAGRPVARRSTPQRARRLLPRGQGRDADGDS